MNSKILDFVINTALDNGADEVEVSLLRKNQEDLYTSSGKISLLRSTEDISLSVKALIGKKKGSIEINQIDEKSIETACETLINITNSSPEDEANVLNTEPVSGNFAKGLDKPDYQLMYDRIAEFIETVNERYPKIILDEGGIKFVKQHKQQKNSHGVNFSLTNGFYDFEFMFSAKDGSKVSSFNGIGFMTESLDKPLIDFINNEEILKQNEEQVETRKLNQKFTGTVIITPDALNDFISSFSMHLKDHMMYTGTSKLKDKLNCQIAADNFTMTANPVSNEFTNYLPFTNDSYKSENLTVIENGILKSFLLSDYGARKTGLERNKDYGTNLKICTGNISKENMIKNVEKGILLARFSGGKPNDNGDITGVAKNSYYIENGKIQYPVSEVMISANLFEMLMNIKDISSENVNNGFFSYPWIQTENVVISG